MWKLAIMKALTLGIYSGLLAAGLPILGFNYYVFCENRTNHTGVEPYLLLLLFVPVAFVSFRRMQKRERKWMLQYQLQDTHDLYDLYSHHKPTRSNTFVA
jgi:hypothetical protein